MSHEEELTPAQKELEQALSSLRPARGGPSRDETMFRAGWACARRQGRRWSAALAAACVVLSAAAILSAFRSPETRVMERVVYRMAAEAPRPAPPVMEARLPAPEVHADYLLLRQEVLEKGVDALPAPRGGIAHEDLQDVRAWLGRPARAAAPPETRSIFPRWLFNGDRS